MELSRSKHIYALVALLTCLFMFFFSAQNAFCSEMSIKGSELSLFWVIPFVCMLFSIAWLPLFLPKFWHHHFGKISVFWASAFILPFAFMESFGMQLAIHELLRTIFHEYIPFIVLLLSLYTVAGGIYINSNFCGTPKTNTSLLCIGTFIASIIGTTGAAMILIKPLLRANRQREYKTHSIIFFIFLVANIGGVLSPLGDPPLFLGFLQGVSFFWPVVHMFPTMLFMTISLLLLYFVIDTVLYTKEKNRERSSGKEHAIEQDFFGTELLQKISFEGKVNIPLLFCILCIVIISGTWKSGLSLHFFGIQVMAEDALRDFALLCVTCVSLFFTSKESRKHNNFTWEPILEVAKVFFGIFISMIPVLAILEAGSEGKLAFLVEIVNQGGKPHNGLYFFFTGLLSSFLDNAPTYLVFFTTAGHSFLPQTGHSIAELLMTDLAPTLAAISAGAVFMGANTYLGNAPNFMVRSIAENAGVQMPSFFGYMLWSGAILCPLFLLLGVLYF